MFRAQRKRKPNAMKIDPNCWADALSHAKVQKSNDLPIK